MHLNTLRCFSLSWWSDLQNLIQMFSFSLETEFFIEIILNSYFLCPLIHLLNNVVVCSPLMPILKLIFIKKNEDFILNHQILCYIMILDLKQTMHIGQHCASFFKYSKAPVEIRCLPAKKQLRLNIKWLYLLTVDDCIDMNITCNTVVCPLIRQYSVFFSELFCLHLIVKNCVSASFIIRDCCFSEPHIVDVHVGWSDSELTNVFIQRISLKPHGTQKCYLGKLIVKYILPIYNPHS